jgi:glycerophosphoryl diester phosphodiesterase
VKPILKIGHRGAKGHVAENTIPSFYKALDLGCDGVELDVHLSADGHVIIIHDETTDRVTGSKGVVRNMKLHEIKKLRVGGSHEIPTLGEALDAIGKFAIVNIELKTDAATIPVADAIERYVGNGYAYKKFIVSSFDWSALKTIRERNPEIPLGVLTETDLDLAVGFAGFVKAETIHPHFLLLDESNIKAIQAKGFKVFPFTVNRREDIDRLRRFGVDGIITDFPERL